MTKSGYPRVVRERKRGAPLTDAIPKGERRFDVLFEPSERKSLASAAPTRNHVIVNELDNVRSCIMRLSKTAMA